MTALTTTPVQAAAITAGLTTYLPVSEPCPLGDITIAADDERPEDHWVGKPGERVAEVWTGVVGTSWITEFVLVNGRPGLRDHPVPVGRVACTATVTACLPSVLDPDDLPDVPELIEADGVVRHWPHGAFHDDEAIDITEDTVWQPDAWTPGGWVLVLANITPVEAP